VIPPGPATTASALTSSSTTPPVRRKNPIRRSGKIRLRDAPSDSADDDGLPAVVGAGRRLAGGGATPQPAGTAAGTAMPVDGGAPTPTSLSSATQTSTPPGCSGSDGVLVVEPAEHRLTAHLLRRHRPCRWQPSASDRRLHPQAAMRPAVVIANVLTQNAFGVAIVEHDHVVEAISSQVSDHPFAKRIRVSHPLHVMGTVRLLPFG
jgi:hypothetical protein